MKIQSIKRKEIYTILKKEIEIWDNKEHIVYTLENLNGIKKINQANLNKYYKVIE